MESDKGEILNIRGMTPDGKSKDEIRFRHWAETVVRHGLYPPGNNPQFVYAASTIRWCGSLTNRAI